MKAEGRSQKAEVRRRKSEGGGSCRLPAAVFRLSIRIDENQTRLS